MRTAINLDDLDLFLNERRRGFLLERVTLHDAKGWGVEHGILKHRTGGFFNVVGVNLESGEDRVFLYQPQSAVTGLLTSSFEGQRHVLMQARAEPGTQGTAQYGPTIQSTMVNYLGLHGGQPAAYTDHFIRYHPAVSRVIHDSEQLDLGERYLHKSKRLAILECHPDIEVANGYIWVQERLIPDAVRRSYFLNSDLRALLAVFPWGRKQGVDSGIVPACQLVIESLSRPLDPNVIGAICAKLSARVRHGNFKELSDLENWNISDNGFFEKKARQGFAIEFYYCEASGREVRSWFQPLVNSRGTGYAALYCREVGGALEVLVRIGSESGLKTGHALLPTVLDYPDCTRTMRPAPGKVLLSTMESDEGGRFRHDLSRYELVLVPRDYGLADDLFWVSIAELKWFLSHSNLCTIQLRGLSSMLLGELPC